MSSLLLLAFIAAVDPVGLPPPVATKPADKIVCRYLETTGSRVAGKRVCMPKSEWNRAANRTSEEVSNAISRVNSYTKAQ